MAEMNDSDIVSELDGEDGSARRSWWMGNGGVLVLVVEVLVPSRTNSKIACSYNREYVEYGFTQQCARICSVHSYIIFHSYYSYCPQQRVIRKQHISPSQNLMMVSWETQLQAGASIGL